MKIRATQDFLHGEKRFEAGKSYTVDDAEGGYFVYSGWATSAALPDVTPTVPAEVTLDVHDAASKQTAPKVEG